jgi:hypothetical protein
MRSVLTPGLIIILVFFICLVLPAILITKLAPDLEPVDRRRRLQFWSAVLSGLPMISILTWDSLGIPPSHAGVTVGLFFILAMIMPIVAMPVIHLLFRRGPAEIVFIFSGFGVAVSESKGMSVVQARCRLAIRAHSWA